MFLHGCATYLLTSLIAALVDGTIRVMTFNTWSAGRNVNDGLRKVAKHIDAVAPDLVALQDMDSKASLKTLLSHLEHRYMGVTTKAGSPVAILTKYKYDPHLIAETKNGIGVRIDVDSWMYIHFWSVQLPFDNYGPHLLFNSTGSLSPQDDIIDREKGRLSVLKEILENQKMKRWLKASKFVSLIVAGDFGSPSHLDWNEENKELHRGLTVEWPVTKVMDDANFIDSYRNLHTDAKVSPGVTWSTIVKTNLMNPALSEPQDRIDFIFYQGRIIPKKSFTYAGSMVLESEPNHRDNDYPSQRYAVVTEFAEEVVENSTINPVDFKNITDEKRVLKPPNDRVETKMNLSRGIVGSLATALVLVTLLTYVL